METQADFDPSQFVCEICDQSFNDCHCDDFFDEADANEGYDYPYQEYRPVQEICKYYLNGTCKWGNSCRFSHETAMPIHNTKEICKFYKEGTCRNGGNCPFSHELLNGQGPTKEELNEELQQLEKEIEQLTIQLVQKQQRRLEIVQTLFGDLATN